MCAEQKRLVLKKTKKKSHQYQICSQYQLLLRIKGALLGNHLQHDCVLDSWSYLFSHYRVPCDVSNSDGAIPRAESAISLQELRRQIEMVGHNA